MKNKQNLHFVQISPKQILSTFDSKTKKDANDKPVQLSRIILPSQAVAKSAIGDNATIIVPSWTIMDDKFHRANKILNINLDKSYEVQYNTKEKDEQGYFIKEKIIVDGKRLVEAFEKAEKDKVNEAAKQEEQKQDKKIEQKKEKEISR